MKRIAIFISLLFVATAVVSVSGNEGFPPAGEPDDGNPCMASCTASHSIAPGATDGTWSIEVVDAVGKTGKYTDIVYRPDGTVFISYYDFLDKNLKCAYQAGGTWDVDEVDTDGDVGAYTSIALKEDGQPSIAYYDGTHQDLKYAARGNDGWTTETVDADGTVGRYASLAVDRQGIPHIVYYDAGGRNLKYAVRSGGNWQVETVASNGDAGRYAAIALDESGEPHCTYGLDETTLMYAHRTADGWHSGQVDSEIKLFESTAIAIEDGVPHVGYFDTSDDPNWRLRYAVMTDGAWNIEVVDPDIYGFWNERGLKIAVRDGIVHLGYFHWDDWDVGYAYRYDARWTTQIVESQGDIGAFASITLDTKGYPHMSYMDRSNLALKYAHKTAYAPVTPEKPEGPGRGRTGTQYTYATSTGDLDGDEVQYGWDWDGDRTVDRWTGFQPSGEKHEAAYTWDSDGTYTIRVKARDSTGRESDWSAPLQVSMPYSRAPQMTGIWQWLTMHLPFLSPLLSSLS